MLDLCEDLKNIYIVSELIRHGTLDENLDRIKKAHASVGERDCANIVYQILSAVNFLSLNSCRETSLVPYLLQNFN